MIQPPGEPREQHLVDVRQKKFELHKISKISDENTGRVDIHILVHFLGQLHLSSKFQDISIGNFKTS